MTGPDQTRPDQSFNAQCRYEFPLRIYNPFVYVVWQQLRRSILYKHTKCGVYIKLQHFIMNNLWSSFVSFSPYTYNALLQLWNKLARWMCCVYVCVCVCRCCIYMLLLFINFLLLLQQKQNNRNDNENKKKTEQNE